MIFSNLIIYKLSTLCEILQELEKDLNFKILEVKSEEILKNKIKDINTHLIITKNKIPNIDNQLIFDQYPIKVSKLIEKINIEFMKKNFINQSKVKIDKYLIDLNAREISSGEIKLRLTEKEINTIIYLSKNKKTTSIDELEKNVWQYQSNIETHTVETHIYRLRKKILKKFNDKNFIISKKNGYQIK